MKAEYEIKIAKFIYWADKPLQEITKEDIKSFMYDLVQLNYTEKELIYYAKALRFFYENVLTRKYSLKDNRRRHDKAPTQSLYRKKNILIQTSLKKSR